MSKAKIWTKEKNLRLLRLEVELCIRGELSKRKYAERVRLRCERVGQPGQYPPLWLTQEIITVAWQEAIYGEVRRREISSEPGEPAKEPERRGFNDTPNQCRKALRPKGHGSLSGNFTAGSNSPA